MSIFVVTQGGESNLFPVFFSAARDVILLPKSMVRVANCDNYSSVNICLRTEPEYGGHSLDGVHSENWFGHGGKDIYNTIPLRNGWVIFQGWFTAIPEGVLPGNWATVTVFPNPSIYGPNHTGGTAANGSYAWWEYRSNPTASTSMTVDWGTGLWGRLSYYLDLSIMGPRGVPYQ